MYSQLTFILSLIHVDSQMIFLFSLSCMISSMMIPALSSALTHLQFSDNLESEAGTTILMNDANVHRSIYSAQSGIQKFLAMVEQEKSASGGLRSSHRLISGIKRDTINAAAEFAVYEQIHKNSNPKNVEDLREDINFLLPALAKLYISNFSMTQQKAEAKIKEDVFFALSELDIHGYIACSDILMNPADAIFAVQNLPKKTA